MLFQTSVQAEGYAVQYYTLLLDLTSTSGFATDYLPYKVKAIFYKYSAWQSFLGQVQNNVLTWFVVLIITIYVTSFNFELLYLLSDQKRKQKN